LERFYYGNGNSCCSNNGYSNDDFYNGYDNYTDDYHYCNDSNDYYNGDGSMNNGNNDYYNPTNGNGLNNGNSDYYSASSNNGMTSGGNFDNSFGNGNNGSNGNGNNGGGNGSSSCRISNTATAQGYLYSGGSSDGMVVSDEDTITLGCILADIEKTADRDTANAGDRIRYTITFRNMSNREMYNVTITDQLPDSINVIATSINPFPKMGESLENGINLGRVAAGASKTLTFTATVADDVSEDIVNRAFADFNFRDESGREQYASTPVTSVTTSVESAGITVTKTADKSYITANGEEIEYTITVTNNSSHGISDLVVTDNLPNNLIYVQDSTTINGAAPIDADPSGGIYIGNLASGARVIIKFSAAVNI